MERVEPRQPGSETAGTPGEENIWYKLVSLCPDVMGVHCEGRLVLLNDAGVRLLGAHSADQLLGRPVRDFIHPDSAHAVRQRLATLSEDAGPLPLLDQKLLRLDGSAVDVEVTSTALSWAGRPAVLFVARETTRRTQAEDRLRLLLSALEYAPDGLQIVGLDGRVVYSNHTVADIYGFSPGELAGKHVNEMNADPDFASREIIPAIGRTGRWDGELAVKHKDGRVFPIWLTASLVRDGDQAVAMIGIIRDVTRRKRLEEQLREERDRVEAIVETSPVGVVVADASRGEVVFVNQEAQRLLGSSHEAGEPLQALEGAAVYRRPDGVPYEMEDMPLERALRRGEAVRAAEVVFETLDGRSVRTLVNATPVYGTSGEIAGAIATIQDMTPLEELEQLRNDFLAMVSHELRTPITAIKGAAATALQVGASLNLNEARELFEIVDDQAGRLRDLVSNLMDITRIEAGALAISPEPVDLRSVCDEARAAFRHAGGSHELLMEIPDELPLVNADRKRLAQVFANLLSNAAKFSPASEPIAVSVEVRGDRVCVHVRDRGRGIPEEKIPYLFKKFSQVHEDAGGFQGSGLGLAICKGIVEAHGGQIWAESGGAGLGATFSFSLPIGSGPPARPLPLAGSELPETRSPAAVSITRKGPRPRILVVDDDPQILRYLRRTLDDAGYEPVVNADGAHVVSFVELQEPDLLLMDLRMPGMNGFEVLQRVREFSSVPVIFLTASDSSEDAVRALKLGADDYITKPFAPPELLARIEATLRHRAREGGDRGATFELGDLRIDFAERRVTVGGRRVVLSPTEYKLLHELASNAGRVLTHDQILAHVWGPEYRGATDLLRSFVVLLRRRLGDQAKKPRFIFTEPRVGYRMPQPGAVQPDA